MTGLSSGASADRRPRLGFRAAQPIYGRHVGAFVQLELQRADGSLVVVGTDDTWSATTTRFVAADSTDALLQARCPAMAIK